MFPLGFRKGTIFWPKCATCVYVGRTHSTGDRRDDRGILEGALPQPVDLGEREGVDAEAGVEEERAREDDGEVGEEDRPLGAALLQVGDGVEVLGEVAVALPGLLAVLEAAEPLDQPQVDRDGRSRRVRLWKILPKLCTNSRSLLHHRVSFSLTSTRSKRRAFRRKSHLGQIKVGGSNPEVHGPFLESVRALVN